MNHAMQTPFAGTLEAAGSTYAYRYRTMSVSHLPELQADIERIRSAGQISEAEILQGYLGGMKFVLPEDFPEAQSVLILAIAVPPLRVHFQFRGERRLAYMPPNYYEPGFTRQMLLDEVQQRIIPEAGRRVEGVSNDYHLKLLVVRSGLGQYGRNNISYVEGVGSFLILRAFLTDYRFAEDSWGEIQRMDLCQDCTICLKSCPGGAIRADRFTLDAGRCISLYNEVEGVLPDWIPSEAHHAIFGCMKCQAPCPANREAMKRLVQAEEITEEETRQFVEGAPEEKVVLSVSQKLKIPYLVSYPEMVPVVSRNVRALLGVT